MTKEEEAQMQKVQSEFLHDAATTLEIEPDDETIYQGDYCLVFDSHRRAIAVARLAAKNYRNEYDDDFLDNRTKPPRAAHPAVILHGGTPLRGGKFLAVLDFEKD